MSAPAPTSPPASGERFSDLVLQESARRAAHPILSEKDRQRLAQGVIHQLHRDAADLVPLGIDGLPDPLAPLVPRPEAPKDLTVPGALRAYVVALEDYERRIDIKRDELSSPCLIRDWAWTRLPVGPLLAFQRRVNARLAWWAADRLVRGAKMSEAVRAAKNGRAALKRSATTSPADALPPRPRSHDFD